MGTISPVTRGANGNTTLYPGTLKGRGRGTMRRKTLNQSMNVLPCHLTGHSAVCQNHQVPATGMEGFPQRGQEVRGGGGGGSVCGVGRGS